MKVTFKQISFSCALLALSSYSYANTETIEEITQKAIKGDVESQVYLGQQYFQQGDYEQSNKWFERAAEQDDLGAIYYVGLLNEKGLGRKPDYKQAIQWYKTAAEKGYAKAQFKLASLYCPSEDYFKSKENEFKTNSSAKNNQEEGLGAQLFNKGMSLLDEGKNILEYKGNELLSEDCSLAMQWYIKAAEQGNVEAQYNLAHLYHSKEDLVNFPEALKWYKKAADQDLPAAKYRLGEMYYRGQGTIKDVEQAATWLYNASKDNVPEAKHLLGVMLVENDRRSDGMKFIRSAAEDNLAEAQHDLAILLMEQQETWKAGFDWLKKAEEQGYGKSEFVLATLHARGDIIPQDLEKAAYYATLACSKGVNTEVSCALAKEATMESGKQLYNSAKELFNWITK